MEINIKEIFERANMHQIRSFALDGVDDDIDICDITYDQRLKEGKRLTMSRLKRLHKDNPIELSNATDEFYHALTVHDDVFTEIGMKIGARLLFQLLCQGDCTYNLQPK